MTRQLIIGLVVNVIAATALLLMATSARSQASECRSYRDYRSFLKEKYDETPIGMGLDGTGTKAVQMFASPKGTWTVVVITPQGRACPIAAGTDWEISEMVIGTPI